MRMCVYRSECSYMYKYLCLYRVWTTLWNRLVENHAYTPLAASARNQASKARACQITMGYMEVYPALEQTSHSQEKDAFCFGHGCRN
jgi:hypothetical protein